MSKISRAFANGKAFVAFVTCGDPDLETTVKIVKSMADNGADLIELGIPFSDPTADAPWRGKYPKSRRSIAGEPFRKWRPGSRSMSRKGR